MNNGFLFMVQGLAQQGLAVCWGDGFAVDQTQLDMYTGAASQKCCVLKLCARQPHWRLSATALRHEHVQLLRLTPAEHTALRAGDYTAAGFLDMLLDQPFVNNVIISVHYYGPSISTNKDRCCLLLHEYTSARTCLGCLSDSLCSAC